MGMVIVKVFTWFTVITAEYLGWKIVFPFQDIHVCKWKRIYLFYRELIISNSENAEKRVTRVWVMACRRLRPSLLLFLDRSGFLES